jgi:hypothetical protein
MTKTTKLDFKSDSHILNYFRMICVFKNYYNNVTGFKMHLHKNS